MTDEKGTTEQPRTAGKYGTAYQLAEIEVHLAAMLTDAEREKYGIRADQDTAFKVFRALSALADKSVAAPLPETGSTPQQRMTDWGIRCFGEAHMKNPAVRALRLAEEAIEFAQAVKAPPDQLHALIDYVYGREVGDPLQELGGVAVTVLVAAASLNVDFNDVLMREVMRVEAKPTKHFTERNQNKIDLGFSAEPSPAEPPHHEQQPCATCNEMTIWRCADCAISRRGKVPLCEKPTCREEHEKQHPEVEHV